MGRHVSMPSHRRHWRSMLFVVVIVLTASSLSNAQSCPSRRLRSWVLNHPSFYIRSRETSTCVPAIVRWCDQGGLCLITTISERMSVSRHLGLSRSCSSRMSSILFISSAASLLRRDGRWLVSGHHDFENVFEIGRVEAHSASLLQEGREAITWFVSLRDCNAAVSYAGPQRALSCP
jgi:hypothetical protein